jgi:hypothetical protein
MQDEISITSVKQVDPSSELTRRRDFDQALPDEL